MWDLGWAWRVGCIPGGGACGLEEKAWEPTPGAKIGKRKWCWPENSSTSEGSINPRLISARIAVFLLGCPLESSGSFKNAVDFKNLPLQSFWLSGLDWGLSISVVKKLPRWFWSAARVAGSLVSKQHPGRVEHTLWPVALWPSSGSVLSGLGQAEAGPGWNKRLSLRRNDSRWASGAFNWHLLCFYSILGTEDT